MVEQEGPAHSFFDSEQCEREKENNDETSDEMSDLCHELPDNLHNLTSSSEDVIYIPGLGLTVDDDNDPVPKNLPGQGHCDSTPSNNLLREGQEWGWNGFDERKKENCRNFQPEIKGLNGIALEGVTFIGVFFLMFLGRPLVCHILTETNKEILEGPPVMYKEFLRFLGIQLMMSTPHLQDK